jgi:hypothetical protein
LAYDLVRYISPIILVMGTVLNSATILTVMSGKVGNVSTRILLVNLSVCDLAYLHTLFDFWIQYSFGIIIRDKSVFLCKVQYFLTYLTRHCSSWGVLLLTVERLICVRFPLRARSICTKKWTYTLLVIIFIVLFILDSHILIFFDIGAGMYPGRCDYGGSYAYFFFGPWFYIDITAYVIIPFLGITFCNILITMKIFGRSKEMPELLNRIDTTNDTEVKRISIMLLVVSIVFMVLLLPQLLYYFLVYTVLNITSLRTLALVMLYYNATLLLSYTNSSINFILYCLSGSQFRTVFLQLLKDRFC